MTDEELKQMWQRTSAPATISSGGDELNKEMDDELRRFDKTINMRDRRENIAAAIVAVFFSIALFTIPPVLSKIASGLTVLWALVTIYVTYAVKQKRVKDTTLPLLPYLQQYRTYIARQKALLDNILWWYVLPAWACIVLFCLGMDNWPGIAGGTVMAVFIYWLNKYAARKYFAPLLYNLDKEINSLGEA